MSVSETFRAMAATNHAGDAMTLWRDHGSTAPWKSLALPREGRTMLSESPLRLAGAARAFAADMDLRFEDLWAVLVEPPWDAAEVDAFFDAW